MIGLFLISMAIASTDIQRFIADPNIRVNKQPDSNRRSFTVMNIQAYNTSDNNTVVESKDGKVRYELSQTVHKEAMYGQTTNSDGTKTSTRYRIIDGKVESITECKSTPTTSWGFDSFEHACVYMDPVYCSNMVQSEVKMFEEGTRPKIDGKVVLTSIFREGSREKGDNYRHRYVGHSDDAILNGIKEVFGGKATNLLKVGVEVGQVKETLSQVKRLCEQLKVNMGPQEEDSTSGGAAAK
jgi:hypothetical protein